MVSTSQVIKIGSRVAGSTVLGGKWAAVSSIASHVIGRRTNNLPWRRRTLLIRSGLVCWFRLVEQPPHCIINTLGTLRSSTYEVSYPVGHIGAVQIAGYGCGTGNEDR